MHVTLALVMLALPGRAPTVAEPPIPYPHPLVTELLYAVPPGDKGDASADAVRDAVGDEFVELVNPHDKPIQLKGYTITDGTPADALEAARPEPKRSAPPPPAAKPAADGDESEKAAHKQVRFAFPALELKPGEVVVVFNGLKQRLKGPVGDARHAPTSTNESFAGAYVFSMKNDSPYIAFANTADCMILWDPSGKPIEAIHWRHNVRAAKPDPKEQPKPASKSGSKPAPRDTDPPKEAAPGPASDRAVPPPGTLLVEEAPDSRGSVARVGLSRKLVAHTDLPGARGAPFSPGRFDPTGDDAGEEPAPKAPPK